MVKRGAVGLALVAAALFAGVNQAAAQLVLGARAGYTSSNVSVDPADETISRLGSIGGGMFLRFGLGTIGVQPELLIVTKGAISQVGAGETKLITDYVEVPLLLRFATRGASSLSPYALLGPTLSFEIDCKVDTIVAGELTSSIHCDEQDAEHKTFDLGMGGALGLEFAVGFGSLLLEGRYTLGLTDLDGTEVTTRNRSFAGYLGYAIPLGSR